jgi:acyl carrier protein
MKEAIKKYIEDTFMHGEGSVGYDEELYESGLINSMGFFKLLAFIEEMYDVPIDMSELSVDNFTTVNDITTMISSKLENK